MKFAVCSLAMLVSGSAVAQEPVSLATSQVVVLRRASVGNTLPSNTEVWLSLNSGLTSKAMKVGDRFQLSVSRDVMVGDYVVIPRGAPGHGQLTYRTGKGAFGKSAKIEFDLVDVQAGNRFIPVSGHYRIEGSGNTGAAIGATIAVGVFGAFVTGRSATAAQGSEWKAYTQEPVMLAIAPPARPMGDEVAARQSTDAANSTTLMPTSVKRHKATLGDDTVDVPM